MGTDDQNQLVAAAKKVRAAYTQNLGEEIKELFKEIVVNEPRAKVPEVVFVETYLPEFRSIKEANDEGKKVNNSALVKTWISITGSQYKGADIVDRDGKVVITTPPIYTPLTIDHDKQANNKLGGIGDDFILKAQANDIVANEFVGTNLRAASKAVKPAVDETVNEWRKVFEYYDKKLNNNPIKAMEKQVADTVTKTIDEEGGPKYKFGGPLKKKDYEDD